MKILFLANHFITLYSFRKELIKKLVEDKHQVYLSLPYSKDNDFFVNVGCAIIPTPIDRKGMNPIKDFKLIKKYKKIMKEIKPDIIFSYTIKPNIYGCLVSNKLHIKQICNITGTGSTFLKNSFLSWICRFLYRRSIRNCWKVFFQNISDRDFFIKNKLVGNNYDLLPGSGCNLDEHPYYPLPKNETIRFIFIGRVMKLKGIDEYLECAEKIKLKYFNTEFLIAGWNEENDYKKIIKEKQKLGFVNYIGFRNDINEWIKKCHCTILPSHGGEGVPNVLLESAAIGRPCIGSNIPGTSDIIEDGKTGYLFIPKKPNDLVSSVERFLALSYEEKEKMGKEGRELVKNKFDRRIVVDKYLNELR